MNPDINFFKRGVPLKGGGDTHFHPYGLATTQFVVTTRLPGDITIHDDGVDLL